MSDTEKIIALVKMFPLIYDHRHRDYKNIKKKEEAWNEISAELDQHVEAVKRKWKNIRDSYSKYVRSRRNPPSKTPSSNRYRNWIWGREMDSMMPCYDYRSNDEVMTVPVDTDTVINITTDKVEPRKKAPIKRIKQHNGTCLDYSNETHVSDQDKISSYVDMEAVELLFLGFAKTVSTFSPKRQAITKFQISQILMEQELEHQQEMNSSLNTQFDIGDINE